VIEMTNLTILEPIQAENEDETQRYYSAISITLDGDVYCESVTLSSNQLLELFMGSTEAEKSVVMYLIQELINGVPTHKKSEVRAFFYDN